MSNDITTRKNTDIATQERLWLLNIKNGRVLEWTPILGTNKDYVDCTPEGEPIRPGEIPGSHPFIQKRTKEVRNQLVSAGSDPEFVSGFGEILTHRGTEKFKALNYNKVKGILEDMKSRNKGEQPGLAGALIRISNRIDAYVELVHKDRRWFTQQVRERLGL